MRERHPRPPAERTERTRLVGADQLEQFDGHCNPRLDFRPSLRGAPATIAVGTLIAERPPHRTVRAAFPHTAPTSGVDGELAVCAPAPVTRLAGTEPGPCCAGSHSPRSPPLAPPTPQQIALPCSPASQLLRRGLTSHARASSATAPHLPDAGLGGRPVHRPNVRPPRFRRLPFVRDVFFDHGRASVPRIAGPHMLPSTLLTGSASAVLWLSWLNGTPHTIAVYASPPPAPATTQHSQPGARYGLPAPVSHRQDHASFPGAQAIHGSKRSLDCFVASLLAM